MMVVTPMRGRDLWGGAWGGNRENGRWPARGPGRGRGRPSSEGHAAHGGELQDAAMAAPAERNDAQFRGEREVGEKKRRERGRHGGGIQLPAPGEVKKSLGRGRTGTRSGGGGRG